MTEIEITLEPNFSSDNCYAILGCQSSTSPDKLRRAYRDLSRKYHPDQHPKDDLVRDTFIKIGTAYAILRETTGKGVYHEEYKMTLEEVMEAYEDEFGKYRGQYFGRGSIFGLPYSYKLKERLEEKKCCREGLSFSIYNIQFSLFRSWFLKANLNPLLCFFETICTWATVILALIQFLLQETPEIWNEIVIPYQY